MTCVAPFVLLANIGDQHVRALYFNFKSGDQRIFCVNNNVFRFPLGSKANSKLHAMLSGFQAQFNWGAVKLTKLLNLFSLLYYLHQFLGQQASTIVLS